MLFLPYKLDHTKHGFAFFTALIIAACIFVFVDQVRSHDAYNKKLSQFCESLSREDKAFIRELNGDGAPYSCRELFETTRASDNPKEQLEYLASEAPPLGLFASPEDDLTHTLSKLDELYQSFESRVPENLTTQLAYNPADIDWIKMITSTIAHGDTAHLVGNLFFFYIFSSAVELLVGSLLYVMFFCVATVTTSLAYSFATAGIEDALPTVGLSGIVMGTLAALAILAPFARIKCFFWFLLYFNTFTLPALFLAAWYVGWDLYEMKRLGNDSSINYVAHISGAATGALFALVIVIAEKKSCSQARYLSQD